MGLLIKFIILLKFLKVGDKMKKSIIFINVFLFVLFAFASPLFAFTTKNDDTVNITEDINDDIYVMGNTVNISGQVNGDLIAAGTRLNLNGKVTEDLIAAGGAIDIAGEMMDDIRAAGGSIGIDCKVADDVIIAGGFLDIDPRATIGGDLVIVGERLLIDGTIAGKVTASGSSIVLSGKVGNGVEIGNCESLKIADTAEITGDIIYSAPVEAEIEPGAKISGDVKFTKIEQQPKNINWKSAALPAGIFGGIFGGLFGVSYVLARVAAFVSMFVLGIILILIMPVVFARFNERMKRAFGYCVAGGAITLFGIPLASIILCIIGSILLFTIVGAGLGIVTFASNIILLIIYGLAIYASTAFLSFLLGNVILEKSRLDLKKYKFKVLAYLIGLAIIMLAYSIPVAGSLMMFAGIIFGLGGIAMVIKDWLALRR